MSRPNRDPRFVNPVDVPPETGTVSLYSIDGPPVAVYGNLRPWLVKGKGTRLSLLLDLCRIIHEGQLETRFRGLHIRSAPTDQRKTVYFFEARALARYQPVFSKPPFDGIGIYRANGIFEVIGGLERTQTIVEPDGIELDRLKLEYDYPWKRFTEGDPPLPSILTD